MKSLYVLICAAFAFSGITFFTVKTVKIPIQKSGFSPIYFHKKTDSLLQSQDSLIVEIRENLENAGEMSKYIVTESKAIRDKRRRAKFGRTKMDAVPNTYPVRFTALKND